MSALGRAIGVILALGWAAAGFAAPFERPRVALGSRCEPDADSFSTRCGRLRGPHKGTKYENDHLARMTKVIAPSETWTYKYSPAGQRVMKSKSVPASGVQEWVLPDGDETLAEYSGASAAAATLSGIYANAGTDARAVRYSAAGAGTYFWADRLGTVLQLTNDSGDPIRTTFSDAWGNDLGVDDPPPPATGIADKWSFTGRERDVESGYMHFRARTYDPAIGRFLSQDPVWQHNLYYYANNSPTNLTDPFGRDVTEEDQRLFDMKFAEVERLEREQSSASYGAAYADLLDFSVKLLGRQRGWEYFDRRTAQQMLDRVYAKNSWIRGPYGEASKEHMSDLATSLGAARAEFDRFERADEIARVVLVSLDRAGTAASFFMGGGGIVKVLCQKGFLNGVAILGRNAAISAATGVAYNAGMEVAAEAAIAAGADPEDVELAVRGLDATMSILNLVQGAAFRSKNNRMCFVAGTPVETRDGPRPIEQVREGDWVLAWDEDAGELCWSRVEQTFVTPRQPIWRLTLKLPDGSEESLDCTPGHPFWADGEGWVPACHLQPGQDVATLSGPARVASVAPTGRNRTVYNFEVAGTHSYFVGESGVLVHNSCSVHRNKLTSRAPTEGYTVRSRGNRWGRKEGDILKFGETTRGRKRYSESWLKRHDAELFFEAKGSKRAMHDWQHNKILDYKSTHGGQRPPLNKSDW